MEQLNVSVTPDFERTLIRYMQIRGITTKAEAVRRAVADALSAIEPQRPVVNFADWIGIGKGAPDNPHPRFPTHDSLWE